MLTFYIDVDDVCADFKGHAIACGVPPWTGTFYTNHPSTWTEEQKTQVRMVDELCKREDFWLGIPVAAGAFEIIAACALHGETFLLTAFPPGNVAPPEMVARVKMEWTTSRLHFPAKRVLICERSEKIKHAMGGFMDDDGAWNATPNVLIDDAEKNVLEWRAAGGIAIHHTPGEHEETIRQIRQLL